MQDDLIAAGDFSEKGRDEMAFTAESQRTPRKYFHSFLLISLCFDLRNLKETC